jgi:signal transduction histidine kinase
VRKSSIAGLTIALLVAIAVLRAIDLWFWQVQTLAAAEARAGNLARILSEYVHESFAAGDAALRQLAIHSRRIGGPEASDAEWLPLLLAARAGLRGIGSISVVDAAGVIRHSTQPAIVGQSRATQYVIRRLAAEASDELVVDTPFRTPLDERTYLIPIGRRLTTAAGAFQGAVVATFLPAAPLGFFRSVDVGARGLVSVLHPDGVVMFREPSAANPIGSAANGDPVFIAARRGGTDGVVHGPLAPGGPDFLTGYHVTASPPLYLAVSLDRAEVLADWRRQVVGSTLFFAVLAGTVAITLAMLFRQMDQKAAAERALEAARREEADRLREANEQLTAALALKDEFLMTVSHELRTPLNAIHGWTRVLIAGGLDHARARTALDTIDRNAKIQTRLVDDLLDVSRATAGRLRLDVKPVSLGDVARAVIETSTPAAEAKAITVCCADAATRPVRGDSDRLQQVVWNLVANAIKFTPEGGRVEVSVRDASGGASFVDLVVSDTGSGIAPEFLPYVFEPFRQGDSGPRRRYGGLGLGLAIVRSIVESHGGSVTASSDGSGRGARFVVRLPSA